MSIKGATIAVGIRRYLGLMFRTKNTKPLIFLFDKPTKQPIHSWFVFFPFKAKWYDEDNKLIEERVIYPWQSSVQTFKKYVKLVEVPIK